MADSIKINKLEIENVKRIKAVKIEPTKNGLTIVGGNNNQGKTSVLDSIAWALGGDRYKPCPSVDCIVVLRPTKVRSLYCQMVGRGTRLSPETNKDHLLLLDFLWHTERHELCHPASLICESAEVAQKMTENMEKDVGCVIDIEEAEKTASEDVVAQREEALAKQLSEMKRRKKRLVDPLQFEMSIQAEDLSGYVPAFGWEMAPPSEGKRSMDRASGSGVFARDPDAMLDLIELDVTDDLRKQEQNKTVCATCQTYLDSHFGWEDDLSQDDLCSQVQMMNYCREHLSPMQMRELQKQIDTNLITTNTKTAWRIDGTLREFPKFKPVNLWFDYPIHHADQSGALDDVQPEDEKPNWKKGQEARKKQGEVQRKNKQAKVDMAIESFRFEHHDTYPTVKELYEQIKSNSEAVGEKYPAEKTLWNSLKKYGYTTDKETKRIIPLP